MLYYRLAKNNQELFKEFIRWENILEQMGSVEKQI